MSFRHILPKDYPLAEKARAMTVDTREPAPAGYTRPIRGYGYASSTRMEMIHDLAARDLTYKQIGRKYGRKENAVKQFAIYNKAEIAVRRAELLMGLQAACDGRVQYRVNFLKQIVLEAQQRLEDLQQAWKAQEGWTVAGHAVWNAYHRTWCRYRELQADFIRQIQEETDPPRLTAREEAEVDIDQLFDAVCPRCREPISAT
jgi:hypothetical protein